MDVLRLMRITGMLFSVLLLLSCSSGGSDTVAGGGIGGTGYVGVGTVTEFGSIIVNGVRMDTTNASVFIGGRETGTGDDAIRNNLKVGQVVVVEGALNEDGISGNALRVMFSPYVKGPATQITTIDTRAKRIVVLGQNIIIDDSTILIDTTFANLSANNVVEVSGILDASGELRATYLRKVADSFNPSMECEVKVIVQNLNSSEKTFNMNALTIDYATADMSRLPGAAPAEGQLVNVRGTVDAGDRLIAQEITPADETRIAGARRLDTEGFVTVFSSTSDFMVGYVRVTTQGNTRYKGGLSDELAAGTKIRVKGPFVNGVLVADQIFFLEEANLQSQVTAKDMDQGTLSLHGLDGITIAFTKLTKTGGLRQDFSEIQVGDSIRIRGLEIGNSSVVRAARVQVMPSSDIVILQGFVDAVAEPRLTIIGFTVDTTAIANFGGMSRTEFFHNVKPGSLVKSQGRIEQGSVTWEEITIEENL